VRALSLLVALTLAVGVPYAAPVPAEAANLATLKAQLAELRKEVQGAADTWDAAQTKLENTQALIKKTDKRIKSASARLLKTQRTLEERANAMYRSGDDGMLEFMLGARTWDDFITRMDYVTIIASSDAALAKDIKATRAQLEIDKKSYQDATVLQKADVATAKAKTDQMDAAFAAVKTRYDKVLADIAAAMARQHPGSGKYVPGPNGMVFPVQGPCAYSDTWGAPRSGGRHHMGTDIMASRGTPCVATCSGTVRPHYNSLGGKSITLTGDNGWTFYYAHLNGYAVKGGRVKAGQLIGWVGNTGNAAGGPCHLHFQMGPHGAWVDPYRYLRGMQ
jgi:murein DD-endopeptidase MepM/ murein hydrolase activator NlpD